MSGAIGTFGGDSVPKWLDALLRVTALVAAVLFLYFVFKDVP
jgi:hypothetical protein